MRFGIRIAVSCAALSLALLPTSAPAVAKLAPITGKLNARGYTVSALAPDGRGKAVWARRGGFRLQPPAGTVTLQLRAPNGKYAGPIVVGRKGGYAIVGVRAGARLGRVRIDARDGYAKLARRLPRRWLDPSRLARIRHGVPLGAGNYGFVRSRRIKAAATASGLGGDRDSDGVPDAVDVAPRGNLVFSNFRRSRRTRSAQIGDYPPFAVNATLKNIFLENTVNANALPGLNPDQLAGLMDTMLVGHLWLDLNLAPSGNQPGSHLEFDCRGRIYCTPHPLGGTGRLVRFDPDRYSDFPDCCLDTATGLGEFEGPNALPGAPWLVPAATSAQIGSGDELIWRLIKAPPGGYNGSIQPADYLTTLPFIFASSPALVSYSDTAGHSANVSYPVAAPGPGTPGGVGTSGNGFPVGGGPCPADAPPACTAGDVVVTLTYWRPQRPPIPPGTTTGGGDPCYPGCQWVDIGRLVYLADLNFHSGLCPPNAFATKDPDLSIGSAANFGVVSDSAPDRAANAQNTFTFTVDLSDCVRDIRGGGDGPAPTPPSWGSGEELAFGIEGSTAVGDPAGRTSQLVVFRRQ